MGFVFRFADAAEAVGGSEGAVQVIVIRRRCAGGGGGLGGAVGGVDHGGSGDGAGVVGVRPDGPAVDILGAGCRPAW